MQPFVLDIIFAVIGVACVIIGWHRGFVRMAGGLVSLVVSAAAGIWGVVWIEDVLGIPLSASLLSLTFAFLTLAVLVSAVLNIAVLLLDLARRLITLIPGFGFLHRVAGAAVGVCTFGALVLGVSYLATYLLASGAVRTFMLSTETLRYGTQILLLIGI